jgi:hypothetical protein
MIRSCPQTTLRSLFVSAMAVSALLPASEGPVQASPVNANPAFESLRATASSWGVSDARVIPAPSATPQSAASVIAPPSMSEQNLRKLLHRITQNTKTATILKPITDILGLTSGTEALVFKSVSTTIDEVGRSFAVSQKPNTDDIAIVVRYSDRVRVYLTNRKLQLRAVCEMPVNQAPKLMVNEKAQADFDAELKIFNDAAAGLPEVPGNA